MTEPKFHVGQRVAVCSSDLRVVIPEAEITDAQYRESELVITATSKVEVLVSARWRYRISGERFWIAEWCLRPLLDDDYTEDQEDIARPVDAQ